MNDLRPALRAGTCVVWHSPTALRIGTHPGVVLGDAPAEGALALRALDGTRTVAQVARDYGVSSSWLCRCVEELARLGWLEPVRVGDVAVIGRGGCADQLTALLRNQVATVLRYRGTRMPLTGELPGLVIWVSETALAPRDEIAALVEARVPVLIVAPETGGAVVGPLIVAGSTSCLRCADLSLARGDRDWPGAAAQLERVPVEMGLLGAAWAAATAASHAIAFLRTGRAGSLGSTWHLTPESVEYRAWARHPRCTCAQHRPQPVRVGVQACADAA